MLESECAVFGRWAGFMGACCVRDGDGEMRGWVRRVCSSGRCGSLARGRWDEEKEYETRRTSSEIMSVICRCSAIRFDHAR